MSWPETSIWLAGQWLDTVDRADAREDECFELLDEVKALEEENRILRYNLATERSRYTLGGTPPGYHEPGAWANRAQPPPSASDESAPPLKRGLS